MHTRTYIHTVNRKGGRRSAQEIVMQIWTWAQMKYENVDIKMSRYTIYDVYTIFLSFALFPGDCACEANGSKIAFSHRLAASEWVRCVIEFLFFFRSFYIIRNVLCTVQLFRQRPCHFFQVSHSFFRIQNILFFSFAGNKLMTRGSSWAMSHGYIYWMWWISKRFLFYRKYAKMLETSYYFHGISSNFKELKCTIVPTFTFTFNYHICLMEKPLTLHIVNRHVHLRIANFGEKQILATLKIYWKHNFNGEHHFHEKKYSKVMAHRL